MEAENKILKLIEDPLAEEKIKVSKIAYLKEDGMNFLRITIDKEPYVDVDTCVKATKIINPILDQEDIIKESYILDVCSKEERGDE